MNESALEGFVKIVEMNSFSAAADALYISQSALSQQIRTLEGQLKLELFQHVPRRVVLTPAGQDLPTGKDDTESLPKCGKTCAGGAAAYRSSGAAYPDRILP